MTRRAGVVIVEDSRLALIKRVRDGRTYFLTPGGGLEPGETYEAAAVRECHEELGVVVELGEVVLELQQGRQLQRCFDARIVGGEFGTGAWPDHADLTEAEKGGTHEPVWVPIAELDALDVRPPELVALLRARRDERLD